MLIRDDPATVLEERPQTIAGYVYERFVPRTVTEHLCEKFAELAHIHNSKRHEFDECIAEALAKWFGDVFFHSDSDAALRVLLMMKRSATDLYQWLVVLTEEPLSDYVYTEVWWKLLCEQRETDPKLAEIAVSVGKVLDLIERTLATRGHDSGRPPGVRQYPGLDTLVFRLELCAQFYGGKFTIDKKPKGGKGRMIEAINLLRNQLLTSVDGGKKLAKYIPPRDQHPASTYDRAINAARKEARRLRGSHFDRPLLELL